MSHSRIFPEHYSALLAEKVARSRERFSTLSLPAPQIFASEPEHYRMRAEFRIWHEGDDLYYAMFDPSAPKTPVRIDDFPVANREICALMPRLRAALKADERLRHRLFQVEFLSTLSGEMLITLVYHRRLDDDWQTAAEALAAELNVALIGRSRKQKRVVGRDYVNERLPIGGRDFHYRQYEGGFTQPNAKINCQMIEWVQDKLGRADHDLLELYCGNGNFTAPLSQQFRRVLATEISKTSVKAARENFAANGIDNVTILRMSSEEFTSALNGEREFRRLAEVNLSDYALNTVLVDPPRAGLDDGTRALVARFSRVAYISCNPETLARDLQLLSNTHSASHFALFDQFPYTDHMECGVILERNNVD